jgi:competence protein ComEA
MKQLRSWIRNYFGFSRTETNGFLVLLPLIAIFIFSEPVYEWWSVRYRYVSNENPGQVDSLMARWVWSKPVDTAADSLQDAPFTFDPNKVSSADLIQLGLPKKLAERIVRYRKKGGKFKSREDFRKIYGMDSALVRRLEPFIALPEKAPSWTKVSPKKDSFAFSHRPAKRALFDLNLADSSQLMAIYGIGAKLSKRIMAYRTRLGGFISLTQLHEVFGLDTAVIGQLQKKSFVAPGFVPRRININQADKKELTTLPYIRYPLANAITTWRFQHGGFKSVDELKQMVLLDEATFEKIKPYLTVKE